MIDAVFHSVEALKTLHNSTEGWLRHQEVIDQCHNELINLLTYDDHGWVR